MSLTRCFNCHPFFIWHLFPVWSNYLCLKSLQSPMKKCFFFPPLPVRREAPDGWVMISWGHFSNYQPLPLEDGTWGPSREGVRLNLVWRMSLVWRKGWMDVLHLKGLGGMMWDFSPALVEHHQILFYGVGSRNSYFASMPTAMCVPEYLADIFFFFENCPLLSQCSDVPAVYLSVIISFQSGRTLYSPGASRTVDFHWGCQHLPTKDAPSCLNVQGEILWINFRS